MNEIDQLRTLFNSVREIDSPIERERFLDQACGENRSLRDRLLGLLAADREAGDFLESPDLLEASVHSATPGILGTWIGPYKLREKIGEGGMGEVYVAEQTQPICRKVALKIIKPGMATQEVIRRFEAERQALAMMAHPHIASVYDGGSTETGQPYFVMELVRGVPITRYCDQQRLEMSARLKLFVQVCRAAEHAHQKGIIHRDIKPSNVLVSEIDGEAVPKVIDFGIAKAVSQRLTDQTLYTSFSQVLGTPLYMSPEQAGTGVIDVDTRSDVYSLGVTLYELLTGSTPFDRDTLKRKGLDEFRRILREEDPQRPSDRISTLNQQLQSTISQSRRSEPRKLRQSVRGELDWIVLKSLERDRTRRYQSAGELAEDIGRFLEGAPVKACPPSTSYRFRKFARRNRATLTLAVSILLALTLGLVVACWQAFEAHASAKESSRIASLERQAREQSQSNLALAMQAVDDMYDDIATNWLNSDQSLTGVQESFVNKALEFYAKLLNDPGQYALSDRDAARMGHRSALLHRKLGHMTVARKLLSQAIDRQRSVLHAMGSKVGAEELKQLAFMLLLQGELAWQAGSDEHAIAAYTEAIELVEKQHQRKPDAFTFHAGLALFANNLALVYEGQGNLNQAESWLRNAMEHYGQVGMDRLKETGNLIGYLGVHGNLSGILLKQKQTTAAVTTARKALEEARGFMFQYSSPDSKPIRDMELILLSRLAEALAADAQPAEAVTVLEESRSRQIAMLSIRTEPCCYLYAQMRGWHDRFPGYDEPNRWSEYLRTTLKLAELKLRLGEPVAAETLLGRATITARMLHTLHPGMPRHHVDLANLVALTALVLKDRHVDESRAHALAAARLWQAALEQFPFLEERASESRAGGSDYQWFVQQFPELDIRDSDRVTQAPAPPDKLLAPLGFRARAAIQMEFEEWDSAASQLQRLLELRTTDEPYDQLSLCFALSKLDRRVEAELLMARINERLQDSSSLEYCVRERLQQVRQLLGEPQP